MSRSLGRMILALLLIAGGFLIGQAAPQRLMDGGAPAALAPEAAPAAGIQLAQSPAPAAQGSGRPAPVVRPELAEEERATISLFERASPSVVYITSLAQRQDYFSMNIQEIPQGSGSGFIWDR